VKRDRVHADEQLVGDLLIGQAPGGAPVTVRQGPASGLVPAPERRSGSEGGSWRRVR
jgi:hypothetical protein